MDPAKQIHSDENHDNASLYIQFEEAISYGALRTLLSDSAVFAKKIVEKSPTLFIVHLYNHYSATSLWKILEDSSHLCSVSWLRKRNGPDRQQKLLQEIFAPVPSFVSTQQLKVKK